MPFRTRGLRGCVLEEWITRTNLVYQEESLALVQKIPTPIKPMEINPIKRNITLAYFEQKSTVDYLGVVQGVPICFDAKESKSLTYMLGNVHAHQMDFMTQFEEQKGISFILLRYTEKEEMYYLPFTFLKKVWDRMQTGGRKSFTYEELDVNYRVYTKGRYLVHYLENLQRDLENRE
ncbi:Holliday junction resolvase RecU [Clostridia bacterium]|nr:Holliday junction resolvase RecU [Clostridia bacterium]